MIVEQYRGFALSLRRQGKMYAVSVAEQNEVLYQSDFAFTLPVDAAEHGMDYVEQVIESRPLEEEARQVIRARAIAAESPAEAVPAPAPKASEDGDAPAVAERRKR